MSVSFVLLYKCFIEVLEWTLCDGSRDKKPERDATQSPSLGLRCRNMWKILDVVTDGLDNCSVDQDPEHKAPRICRSSLLILDRRGSVLRLEQARTGRDVWQTPRRGGTRFGMTS